VSQETVRDRSVTNSCRNTVLRSPVLRMSNPSQYFQLCCIRSCLRSWRNAGLRPANWPCPALGLQPTGDHCVGKPSATGQPTRPTQPFILPCSCAEKGIHTLSTQHSAFAAFLRGSCALQIALIIIIIIIIIANAVVDVDSVDLFKSRLDNFWISQDVKYDYTVNLAGTGDRSEYDIESYWKVLVIFQEWYGHRGLEPASVNIIDLTCCVPLIVHGLSDHLAILLCSKAGFVCMVC